MPVISKLSEVVKFGKTSSGGLPAKPSATIDALSQAQVARPGRMPISGKPGTIPVIPIGVSLSILMTTIEALMFKSYEDRSSLSNQLIQKYNTDLEKSKITREAALVKLNSDLIVKQEVIKQELVELEKELEETISKITELKLYQESEMTKYMSVIF